MFNERYVFENLKNSILGLKQAVYNKVCDFELEIYTSKEPLNFSERQQGKYRKICVGDKWGDLFDCAWFHCTAKLPNEVKLKKVVFVIDINGEGLIYDDSGYPLRGITNVKSGFDRTYGNPGKRIFVFKENADGGETVDFWMDAGCNDLVGKLCENGTVKEAYAAVCNEKARTLFYDMTVLYIQAETCKNGDPIKYELLSVLSQCRKILCNYNDSEIEQCLEITGKRLSLDGGENPALNITAFGHAHIDLAWLWPIRETKRKGARTFATALELMGRYDEYIFGASSPQLYQWIKEEHPRLYENVKKFYKEGRWELLGAMWVEPDLNLISGESVVRQLLYGNRFWKKEFGSTVDFVWTPDTFGYSAALPQIFKKSGINYFSTIKMSWNLINPFPYNNFVWRGIDGSEVLVHMPPEGSYVSEGTAKSVQNIKKQLNSVGQFGEVLMPFGIGDGGGGPSPCHLEYLKRGKNLPGLCPIKYGKMSEFFERFSERADMLPVWDKELYLERHLGVYTSACENKKFNRLMENTLRDAEMLSAIAFKMFGYSYPQSEFEEIWKETLLYQFHDILPGSSIQRVYDESLSRYEILYKQAWQLKNAAAEALARQISVSGMNCPKVVFNTLSFEREYIYETENGYKTVKVPPIGYTVFDACGDDCKRNSMTSLENNHIKVEFNTNGSISSFYNKDIDAEFLNGDSNVLLIYDDIENAWNLQYDYLNQTPEKAVLTESRFESDNCKAFVTQKYKYGDSVIEVILSLYPESDVLDITINADWHEKHKMLRIAFDTSVKSDYVYCETQFGYVTRSSKNNTSEEQAQIEMPAHKWISLSKGGRNFSLLNDCKYGYSVRDNLLELNALRGTDYPATNLDFGKHTFKYGIYTDNGLDITATVKKGYEFNFEPVVCNAAGDNIRENSASFFNVSSNNVIIDGIKKSEDSDSIIIRTYEAAGMNTEAEIKGIAKSADCRLCDLMENEIEQMADKYHYKPFEIVTIKSN